MKKSAIDCSYQLKIGPRNTPGKGGYWNILIKSGEVDKYIDRVYQVICWYHTPGEWRRIYLKLENTTREGHENWFQVYRK